MAQSKNDCTMSSELDDDPFLNEKGVICPLCKKEAIYFYCENCIRSGSFTHSKDKRFERFAEKKLKLLKLNEQKAKLLERFRQQLCDTMKLESLEFKLFSQKQLNKNLKRHLDEIRNNTKKHELEIRCVLRENEKSQNRMLIWKDKIIQMAEVVRTSRTKISQENEKLNEVESSIMLVRQENIEQLVKFIFPISKTENDQKQLRYFDPDCELDAIYVTGQWELAGETTSSSYQYNIIESSIPANGNYSAYTEWTLKKAEDLDLTDEDQQLRNSAYSIVTALSFVSHLVTIIGSYLDTYMPKYLTQSEFSGREFEKEVFLHKVAKLNANVIHLCLSQNVDPSLIRPHHTLDNLMLLLGVDDLGRSGAIKTSQRLPEYLEDSLSTDLMLIDEREDPSDDLSSDWVEINEFSDIDPTLICEFGTFSNQNFQSSSYRPSFTGDLISSMTSLWRTATGQK